MPQSLCGKDMRIFVGSLQQETNTFSTVGCRPEDFDIVRGEAMAERTPAIGIFREKGAEVIPSYYAIAVPSGRMKKGDFLMMVREMEEALRDAGKVDAVWLYLHGAMDVEELGSGELYLLKTLRAVTGMSIPYAVALDFHANLSPEIVRYANVIRGYRTAPHRDMKQTQEQTARLLIACVEGRCLPTPCMEVIPVILPGDRVLTDCEPFASVNRLMDEMEQRREVMSVSVFIGQNWADTPNNHISIVAIGEEENASRCVGLLREKLYKILPHYRTNQEGASPAEALEKARKIKGKTVFLSDSGDNTTAGARGNRTDMLSLCVSMDVDHTLVAGICLPDLCREAMTEGNGSIEIGGCGKFTVMKSTEQLRGWDGENCGNAVLISDGKRDVILTERRCAFVSPAQFASLGVDCKNYEIVVVKLGYLWPELSQTGGLSIIAVSDGESCTDLHRLPYRELAEGTVLL